MKLYWAWGSGVGLGGVGSGPQVGSHWANTFMGSVVGSNGRIEMKSPPVDLLVWFAPRPDCRLQVVDRIEEDPRAIACGAQVRYVWEGTPKVGDKLVFTQVYHPHPPYRPTLTSNHAGAKVKYHNEFAATAHASGIQVMRDDAEASVLRLELTPGKVEWVVFNPGEGEVEFAGKKTRNTCECARENAANK